MTEEEKALDLLMNFYKVPSNEYDYGMNLKMAKQCALIAVVEIINSNPHSNPLNTEIHSTMQFWQEVKKEIELL